MLFVDLVKGKIKLSKDFESKLFDPSQLDEMANFIGLYAGLPITGASGCNFPEECGFSPDFDLRKILQEVFKLAQLREAAIIPYGNIDETIELIKEAAKLRGLPTSMFFETFQKLVMFYEPCEVDKFIDGMMCAKKILDHKDMNPFL